MMFKKQMLPTVIMVVLLLWVNTWAGISSGQKIGIDFGPTVTDSWNNVPDNGITEDGDVVDTSGAVLSGISITVADGKFFNNDGADNWMGLGTNGGSAPAEFVESVTTDIGGTFGTPDPFLITVAGLNDGLVYDVVAVCTSVPPYANEETLTINGDVSQSVTRSDTRDNGVFHYLPEVSTDGSGNLALAFTNNPQNNPVVCGILITAIGRGRAGGPTPQAEAQDVSRDTDLTWIPGKFAGTHNIYFGDDLDTVAGATVPTVAGSDVNSFDPGRLEFGKTYYWRVDEVNGTPDKTVFAGDVWNFTVEPYSIPIAGADIIATASSFSNNASMPEKTLDGSGMGENEIHAIATETMWFTANNDLTPWIQYEFDGLKKLDTMKVWNSNSSAEGFIGYGVNAVLIEYSQDGAIWAELKDANEFSRASGLPTYNQYDEIAFDGVAAKMVRLNIQSNWGGFMKAYSLSEVQFSAIPAAARTPDPVSGATGLVPNAVVSWRSGREAAQSTVYISSDPNEVIDGLAASATSNTNSINLSSFDLQMGQTYYWRVDEVNNAEAVSVWAGPVWSFLTVAAIIVEDFESYNNISPDRPFQSWLDGYGYSADEFFPTGYGGNGTGAGVGHDIWTVASEHYNGDIMETASTIAGSNQSMPFYYNNTGGVASQTERTFAVPLDWTAGRAQTLSINFRGQVGNTGTLFAKINNTKVVYPRDPGNLALKEWQAWNIDLSSMNASTLQNITTLVIGVEGNGAAGMLLIDDMTLHAEVGELITPTAPDNANLVAYYALDGDVTDSSGNGANGTVNGLPIYGPGVDGQAIQLNGIDDFVDLGVPENWPAGAAPRTLCAWAQTFSVQPGWRIIAGYGSPAVGEATALVMNGTALYGSGFGSDISVGDFWTVEEWHHVGLTYDGSTICVYANGIEVTSGQRDWNTTITVARIGRQVNEANEFWDGLVDEVRLYDRVLSADEMAWLGGKTAPIDKPF